MRYIVHCPYGSEDTIRKKMEEAAMFGENDRVVYIESSCSSPYVEALFNG